MELSTCCKATPLETFRNNPADHHDPIPTYTCEKCNQECDVEDICPTCEGNGWILESLGHNKPVERPCPDCREEEPTCATCGGTGWVTIELSADEWKDIRCPDCNPKESVEEQMDDDS